MEGLEGCFSSPDVSFHLLLFHSSFRFVECSYLSMHSFLSPSLHPSPVSTPSLGFLKELFLQCPPTHLPSTLFLSIHLHLSNSPFPTDYRDLFRGIEVKSMDLGLTDSVFGNVNRTAIVK